jgi:hypothetical protein
MELDETCRVSFLQAIWMLKCMASMRRPLDRTHGATLKFFSRGTLPHMPYQANSLMICSLLASTERYNVELSLCHEPPKKTMSSPIHKVVLVSITTRTMGCPASLPWMICKRTGWPS